MFYSTVLIPICDRNVLKQFVTAICNARQQARPSIFITSSLILEAEPLENYAESQQRMTPHFPGTSKIQGEGIKASVHTLYITL